jgi:hypothetical protein
VERSRACSGARKVYAGERLLLDLPRPSRFLLDSSGRRGCRFESAHSNPCHGLNAMVTTGLLLKDESAVPYRFRLVPELLADTDVMDDGPGGR